LIDDAEYGHIRDINQLSGGMLKRLKHYFLTYKLENPDAGLKPRVTIKEVYDAAEAAQVIRHSLADYQAKFGSPAERMDRLVDLIVEGVARKLKEKPTKPRRKK
jgi:hypothetical protein